VSTLNVLAQDAGGLLLEIHKTLRDIVRGQE